MKTIRLAGCVIRNDNGELLLLHRNKSGMQQWELPGGKLDEGEDAETAAIREIQEELGVAVEIVQHLGAATFEFDDIDWHYTWYEARQTNVDEEPSICEPQTFDDLRYWPVDLLAERSDLSLNLRNLVNSGALKSA